MMTGSFFYFIIIGAFCLGIGILYLYIYMPGRESFIKFTGICWTLYACGFVCMFMYGRYADAAFLGIKYDLDMFAMLSLLYGFYAFIGVKPPGFFFRFSCYMCIWSVVAVAYHFDPLSLCAPPCTYQLMIATALSYIIYRYRKKRRLGYIVSVCMVWLWGAGKTAAALLEFTGKAGNLILYSQPEDLMCFCFVNFSLLFIFLQQSQENWERNQHIFRTITENASDVLFHYENDTHPTFAYVTPSVHNMLGISPQTFYSDSSWWVNFVHPEDHQTFGRLLDTTDNENEKKAVVRIFDRNNNMLWCEVTTSKIRKENGFFAIEGMIRDISATKIAHDQLLSSKEEREILLSYVSHELKTPITSIIGYVTALKDHAVEDQAQKDEMLNVIYLKSRALEKLVLDLVQLSKLETKQFSFNFSLCECLELSETLLRRHSRDGDSNNIKLQVHMDEQRLRGKSVIADMDRLDQVFSNILTNAIRYTGEKRTIIINFGTDKQGKCFVFSLTNYGPVISKENIRHIFDRFYRVKNGHRAANEDSSGLGLTISQEMVLAHHGTIDVISDKKTGTTFTVTLPLYDERNS